MILHKSSSDHSLRDSNHNKDNIHNFFIIDDTVNDIYARYTDTLNLLDEASRKIFFRFSPEDVDEVYAWSIAGGVLMILFVSYRAIRHIDERGEIEPLAIDLSSGKIYSRIHYKPAIYIMGDEDQVDIALSSVSKTPIAVGLKTENKLDIARELWRKIVEIEASSKPRYRIQVEQEEEEAYLVSEEVEDRKQIYITNILPSLNIDKDPDLENFIDLVNYYSRYN